jgi:hypothetical protein
VLHGVNTFFWVMCFLTCNKLNSNASIQHIICSSGSGLCVPTPCRNSCVVNVAILMFLSSCQSDFAVALLILMVHVYKSVGT